MYQCINKTMLKIKQQNTKYKKQIAYTAIIWNTFQIILTLNYHAILWKQITINAIQPMNKSMYKNIF